jgi:membrane protein YdbS with pleckstrin-like domain
VAVWVLVHLPHLLPPVLAFAFLIRLGLWAADQPPQHFDDEQVEIWKAERAALHAERKRPVSRRASRLGLISFLPLTVAFATGIAIYTFNLRGDRPSSLDVWVHTAAATFGLVIVTVKVVRLGWRHIRREVSVNRPQRAISSLVLLALGVPLLATGGWLLVHPNGESVADYFHLIVSAWWTLLFQWHLWRYLGRAVSASLRRPRPADPAPAPVHTSPT